MAAERPEIRVGGRVYTHSRHWRDKPQHRKQANDAQIEYVLREPAHRQPDGPRRTVYERYVPELGFVLRVVEDRLPTGEFQILTAYRI